MIVPIEKINHQRTQTAIQLISSSFSPFLKLIAKILLPFSVLSVVLRNFHILACGLRLFNFSVGKNCMFLLCNGLLLFIATSSGLIGGSAGETYFKAEKSTLKRKGDDCQRELRFEIDAGETDFKAEKSTPKRKGDECQRELRVEIESSEPKVSIPKAETKALTREVDREEKESKMDSLALVLQGREDIPMVEAEEQSHELVSVLEKDEDEDEELGQMSNEELYKKCEDFIKRIKEGIQLEQIMFQQ